MSFRGLRKVSFLLAFVMLFSAAQPAFAGWWSDFGNFILKSFIDKLIPTPDNHEKKPVVGQGGRGGDSIPRGESHYETYHDIQSKESRY